MAFISIMLTLIIHETLAHQQPKSFCYYNGDLLPGKLDRVCPDEATGQPCYYDSPKNLTKNLAPVSLFQTLSSAHISLDMVDEETGNALVCMNAKEVPDWVQEICSWIDGDHVQCAKRGDPIFNTRVKMSNELINLGVFDFDAHILFPLNTQQGKNARSGFFHNRMIHSHMEHCMDANKAGDATVRIVIEGKWGSLYTKYSKKGVSKLLLAGKDVGKWLAASLSTALLEVAKTNATTSYYDCESNMFGNTERACGFSDKIDCNKATQDGCGWRFGFERQTRTACLCDNVSTGPCLRSKSAYRLPSSMMATIYDIDGRTENTIQIWFEAKDKVPGCSFSERLIGIILGMAPVPFMAWGLVMPNIIGIYCTAESFFKPAPVGQHP